MGTQNQISIVIPADVLQQSFEHLQAVSKLLQPYLHALTSTDRQGLAKMGDKTIPFVSKNLDYSKSNPYFTPAYMDVTELEKDLNIAAGLTPLLRICEQLASNLDDTIMLSGSEAYVAALAYYNTVKQAAKMSIPDAKPIFEDLQQRFPRTLKAKVPNEQAGN
ncbi:hypothetical protein CLV51_101830 [Chitinophaga niastensis]|uniref:Uncharacterized protein n=1 Tax=Chitinophaga niastensis TaxID=536980 RepID=A0A2P8HTE3_CHINA|nr:hypothetical protein [Chitinophaga niastensis]PSL49496.1 hypothetical protein CLV51_101830 [Chitinophaga niastensis]